MDRNTTGTLKKDYRRCCKCGASNNDDNPTLLLHRFPKPRFIDKVLLRARVWAMYCFPESDWSSFQSLNMLYGSHKVLCSNHFDNTSYRDGPRKHLNKFAVPTDAKHILKELRDQEMQLFYERKSRPQNLVSKTNPDNLMETRPQNLISKTNPVTTIANNLIEIRPQNSVSKVNPMTVKTRPQNLVSKINPMIVKTRPQNLVSKINPITRKAENLMNVENIDPSFDNNNYEEVEYLSDEEGDNIQDDVSVADSNIMDIEIKDYEVKTVRVRPEPVPIPLKLKLTNHNNGNCVLEINGDIPLNKEKEGIQFATTSSKLKASMEFHNYSGVPLQDLCRLCCVPRNNGTPFYNIYTDDINVIMEQCFGLKATKSDLLPSYICKDCYNDLQKFHDFYFSVHQVDGVLKEKLMQSLKKSGTLPNVFENPAEHNTQDANKLIINIEIEKRQMSFHCPFCEYSYQSKNGIINHIKNFHIMNADIKKEVPQNKKASKNNSNIPRQILTNNNDISHITDSADQHFADLRAFNDLNMSDLITFNEKSLRESNDNDDIPDAMSYCEIPCEDERNDGDVEMIEEDNTISNDVIIHDTIGGVETVDPSLFTDFIIEESLVGSECTDVSCGRIFKSLVFKKLHHSIEHEPYIAVFRCRECGQVYANVDQIINHLQSAHEIVISCRKATTTKIKVKCLFSCEFCLQLYVTLTEVKKHKRRCLPYINNEMKCCGEVFNKILSFKNHYHGNHEKDRLSKQPKCGIFYECSVCDALFCSLGKSIYHTMHSHKLEKKMAVYCGLPLHELKLDYVESKKRLYKVSSRKPAEDVTSTFDEQDQSMSQLALYRILSQD